MHRPQQQVQELHREVLNQPCSPAEPQIRMAELRARLILEEAIETVEALVGTGELLIMLRQAERAHWERDEKPNLIEVIDGLCDTLVVAYGTAEAIGVDLEPFFDEVHRSNMAKRGGKVREDGKQLKPEGWTPPDIAGVLARVQRGECTCPPSVAEEAAVWGKVVHVPGCAWIAKLRAEQGRKR